MTWPRLDPRFQVKYFGNCHLLLITY
jgi:hypothetical protein